MNPAHEAVIFALNPLSKGLGNGLEEVAIVAVAMPPDDDVGVGVSVKVETCFVDVFGDAEPEEEAESLPKGSSRRRRSSAAAARVQSTGLGGSD
jgi:hypothetical protein